VTCVWLHALGEEALRNQAVAYFDAYGRRWNDPAAWQTALDRTTSWL
jgi:hypothetical protein